MPGDAFSFDTPMCLSYAFFCKKGVLGRDGYVQGQSSQEDFMAGFPEIDPGGKGALFPAGQTALSCAYRAAI
jgi:hypothetical protein